MTSIQWTMTRAFWDAIETGSYRGVTESEFPAIREFSRLMREKLAQGQTYSVKHVGLNTVVITWSKES